MPPKQTLDKLLEQYLFSVAATYIELAEPEIQDQLILFINRINTGSVLKDSLTGSPEVSVEISVPASKPRAMESIAKQLEKQWQQALRQPSPFSGIHLTERNATSLRLMTIRQATIEFTISNISKVDQLLAKANIHAPGEIRNSVIINHYQSIKNRYNIYLAKLQALQQKEFIRLGLYP